VRGSGRAQKGRAETTGGTKPGRKRKANTAMALVETSGFKAGASPRGCPAAEEQFCLRLFWVPVDPVSPFANSWG